METALNFDPKPDASAGGNHRLFGDRFFKYMWKQKNLGFIVVRFIFSCENLGVFQKGNYTKEFIRQRSARLPLSAQEKYLQKHSKLVLFNPAFQQVTFQKHVLPSGATCGKG